MVSEKTLLVHALLLGVFITFVYDLLRIFRRTVPHGRFAVSVEDLAFWTYCGSEVFLLMHRESNGSLRWFTVLGALAGMFFYKKSVSELFVKYVSLLLSKALAFLGRVLRWLCRPLCRAGRGAGRICRRTRGRVGRRIKKVGRAIKLKLTFFIKVFKINLKA